MRVILAALLLGGAAPMPMNDTGKCENVTVIVVTAGNTAKGPMQVGVLNGQPVLSLETGVDIPGPIEIAICDGRVTIRKPPKP